MRLRAIYIALTAMLVWSSAQAALSQTDTDTTQSGASDPDLERDRAAVFSQDSIISVRALGMSGALGPFADGFGTHYYNPAHIGGINIGKKKLNKIRRFNFPLVGLTTKKDSRAFASDLAFLPSDQESTFADIIAEAEEGKSHYGHTAIAPNLVLGRMLFAPIYDSQFAAVKPTDTSEFVDFSFRKRAGFGVGLSATDPSEEFYIGIYTEYFSQQSIRGDFLSSELTLTDTTDDEEIAARNSIFEDLTNKYTVSRTNAGFSWRIGKKAAPLLSIVARNLGDTKYKLKSGPGADYDVDQDLAIGFGVSPMIGKKVTFRYGLEVDQLLDTEKALSRKWHTSSEINFFGVGSDAVFGLNGGANYKGLSYGGHINIGIIGMQYANFPEDISAGDDRVIERRHSASVFVNITDK